MTSRTLRRSSSAKKKDRSADRPLHSCGHGERW